jgi:hypothetical protein
MLHIITPRYRPLLSSKLDWFRLQSNMVIPWEFNPLIFLVVINTMYYVTPHHCWRRFCFLDPYVHEHHVLIKCCWEFGKHNHYWLTHTSWCVFCSTIQWNNSVECSQKKSVKLSKLKFIMWIYFVHGLLIYELMCNEKLRTSSVVHPMLVEWLVIFYFAIAKF